MKSVPCPIWNRCPLVSLTARFWSFPMSLPSRWSSIVPAFERTTAMCSLPSVTLCSDLMAPTQPTSYMSFPLSMASVFEFGFHLPDVSVRMKMELSSVEENLVKMVKSFWRGN